MLRKQPGDKHRKLDAERLWAYALKSLSQRAQTVSEVRAKLSLRAAEPEHVDQVIGKLKEYGMLDDNRFAETFAQSKLDNQGFGQARALRDLRARRISPTLAEQAVQKLYSEQDEIALIEAYIRRKYRSANRTGLFQDDKDMASAFRRLRLAGFSSRNVIPVLKRFASRPELLDGMDEVDD